MNNNIKIITKYCYNIYIVVFFCDIIEYCHKIFELIITNYNLYWKNERNN